MDTAALREMPSSLNDACRKLELAADEIERLQKLADDLRASLTAGDTLPIEETPLGRDRMIAQLRAALKDSYEGELYSAIGAGCTSNGLWWPGGVSDAEWFCRHAEIEQKPQFRAAELCARVPAIAAKMVAALGVPPEQIRTEG